jgi:hypothetical protein
VLEVDPFGLEEVLLQADEEPQSPNPPLATAYFTLSRDGLAALAAAWD